MVNLDSSELKKLDIIRSGNFGTLYRCGDKVYKIYNPEVKTTEHQLVKNPMLKHRWIVQSKLNRLIALNSKIRNTDLVEDIITIDDRLAGVVLPFYEGILFINKLQEPVDSRIDCSLKLVDNARELTDHYIYPLDYKLDNIFLIGEDVRIADLDDTLTKVFPLPFKYYKNYSIYILDETVKSFFREYDYRYFSKEIDSEIDREKCKSSSTYDEIKDYIESKRKKYRYVFVDGNFSLTDDRLLDNSRVVLLSNTYSTEVTLATLRKLKERGIQVYDAINQYYLERYINDSQYEECLAISDNKVLKLK